MGDHGHRLCWVFGRVLASNSFGRRRRGEKGGTGENPPVGSEEDERAIGSSGDRTPCGGKRNQSRHCYNVYWVDQQISKYEARYSANAPLSERDRYREREQTVWGNHPRYSPPIDL